MVPDLPGGAAWYDPDLNAIVMDSKESQVRRRFLMAHELAHYERGDRAVGGADCLRLDARQEREADKLCARWLIHIDDLVDAARWSYTHEELADELWVPVAILMVRLDHLEHSEVLALRAATKHHREDHQ
ncbi:ImmA/IrrE family metallo-endopeptidase [Nakamurella silvestris]|nr:ImmA/IrrE family metallo-endopeptidase [Nakamurella silvestris]